MAQILGLEEAMVQDVVQQAVAEMQDEMLQRRRAHLVERGVLIQEQAAEDEEDADLEAEAGEAVEEEELSIDAMMRRTQRRG